MADDVTLCVECGKPAQLNNHGEWLACHSCSPAVGPLCGDCMARHIGEHSLAAEYGYADSPPPPTQARVPDPALAELETELAAARRWSSTLADVGDDLRAELREADERIAELEGQVAMLTAALANAEGQPPETWAAT